MAASSAIVLIAAGCVASHALAQQAGSAGPASVESEAPPTARLWRFELKRENTNRGTDDEATKTTLRLERFFSGAVRLLRLDVPLPDQKTDFEGDPFNPGLGDAKVRVGFQPLKSGIYSFPSFIEVTFPTADPESLGGRKHQLNLGLRMVRPVALPFEKQSAHNTTFELQVQQVNSFGGDDDGKNVANTKFEITLYDVWRRQYTMKFKLKPSVDWVKDGKTGAVAEIEGGKFFARNWRAWLMFGRRVWGPEGIQATYGTKVELGIARTF